MTLGALLTALWPHQDMKEVDSTSPAGPFNADLVSLLALSTLEERHERNCKRLLLEGVEMNMFSYSPTGLVGNQEGMCQASCPRERSPQSLSLGQACCSLSSCSHPQGQAPAWTALYI